MQTNKKEYIDREAFKRKLIDEKCVYPAGVDHALYEMPAADVVEVVHGEWDEEKYPFCNVCPRCGLIIDRTCIKWNSGKLNYCPNCGAKMDGERKEK